MKHDAKEAGKAFRHITTLMHLDKFSTADLVDALKRREGVETHEIGPYATLTVATEGPAIVFVVID